jgi:hypothetical protein
MTNVWVVIKMSKNDAFNFWKESYIKNSASAGIIFDMMQFQAISCLNFQLAY